MKTCIYNNNIYISSPLCYKHGVSCKASRNYYQFVDFLHHTLKLSSPSLENLIGHWALKFLHQMILKFLHQMAINVNFVKIKFTRIYEVMIILRHSNIHNTGRVSTSHGIHKRFSDWFTCTDSRIYEYKFSCKMCVFELYMYIFTIV